MVKKIRLSAKDRPKISGTNLGNATFVQDGRPIDIQIVSSFNEPIREAKDFNSTLKTIACSSTEHCAEKGKEEAPEKQKQQQHSPETANGTRQASYEAK